MQGDARRAARLYGAAEALREVTRSPLALFDSPAYVRGVAEARAKLDEAVFAADWAAGRTMALEQIIAEAHAEDGS